MGNLLYTKHRNITADLRRNGEDFEAIGAASELERRTAKAPLGNGTLTFVRQRELVDFAVEWIETNRG